RDLLREANLRPKKSFGQNFLTDHATLAKIAAACVPDACVQNAVVLEFGAGLGALTAELLGRANRVIAVERDRDLIAPLQQEFADAIAKQRLELREADAQSIDIASALGSTPKDVLRVVCGNLPYQITGSLLERAIHSASHFDHAVFMVQLEVAERL